MAFPTEVIESRPIWVGPGVPRKRYAVDEFHALVETGRIKNRDRLELLEGWLVEKMPLNPYNNWLVDNLDKLLTAAESGVLADEWRVQTRVRICTTDSELEPELVVVRKRRRGRAGAGGSAACPPASEVAIVMEVGDHRMPEVRTTKARVYARAGIPTYWIMQPDRRCIDVFTEPDGPDVVEPVYQLRKQVPARDALPVILDGTRVGAVPLKSVFW